MRVPQAHAWVSSVARSLHVPATVVRFGALAALVPFVLAISGCAGNVGASATHYWVIHWTGGLDTYLSTTVTDNQIGGYAEYADKSFQHYDGTKSADGTYQIGVFTGSTATFHGSNLTLVDPEGHLYSYTEVDKSAYSAAGGPG